MPTKKSSTKKAVSKTVKPKTHALKHVALVKDTDNFWNVQPSIQSLYWILIGIAAIGTVIINFNTNMRVNDLLNQIESQNTAVDSRPVLRERN